MRVNIRRHQHQTAPEPEQVERTVLVPVPGIVEVFSRQQVSGWVHVERDADPVRITLRLDNHEIAGTWATEVTSRTAWGETRGFSLRLHDVWDYAGRRSRLTIRSNRIPLPIAGHGMFRRPGQDGEHTYAELEELLAQGHVFSHDGRLQLSKQLDELWQGRVMELYDLVRASVRAELGHDVFFIYGTLLGAVRDGGYIGHDNDFDCAYLSEHTDPVEVARELHRLAMALVRDGVHVRAFPEAVHVYHSDDPGTRIDLFHLFWDADGRIRFPFGVAGTLEVRREDWQGATSIEFPGGHGLVPVNGEQLVEHIYGPDWRKPDPGFDWDRDRVDQATEAVVPVELTEQVYWGNFYNRNDFDTPSSFCTSLLARADLPRVVLDVGCGEGRDSLAFAASGRMVTGIDSCDIALEHARAKADTAGTKLGLGHCDVADHAALEAVLAEVTGGDPALYHLRFFLHAVSEEVQDGLLAALARHARPGDMLAAEFRTPADQGTPKAHGRHYRRFVDPAGLTARLRADGWTIVDEASGTGLAPYHAANSSRNEDPELARVLARFGS